MIKEVAFVAIAVSDAEESRKFYQEILGLTPSSTGMEGAWVEYDLGGTTIGVGCHPAWKPSRDGSSTWIRMKHRFVSWHSSAILRETNWLFTNGKVE